MSVHVALRWVRFALLGFMILLGGWLPGLPAVTVGAMGATWTINDLGDSGMTTCAPDAGAAGPVCQLRDAFSKAASGDAITFSVTGTITVGSTLTLSTSVTVNGPTTGAGVVVSSNRQSNQHTIFHVDTSATVRMSDLAITDGLNFFTQGAGILNDGNLTLANVTLSGNTAAIGGGAIATTGTLALTNVTLSGNAVSGGNGGGLAVLGGATTITNSTITGNVTQNSGGGIASSGTLTLIDTIVAGNIARGINPGTAPDIAGTVTSGGHNLIGSLVGTTGIAPGVGGDIVNPTPVLAPLTSYGGTTQTVALLPGSPAIDAGGSTCPPGVATDQRGIARSANGACDIGAFESQGFTVASSGDNQSATINSGFAHPLQITASSAHGEPVQGGIVTFAAPAGGASATLSAGTATLDANGHGSITVTANGTAGSYSITTGAIPPSLSFFLTNLPQNFFPVVSPQPSAPTGGSPNPRPVPQPPGTNGGSPNPLPTPR